MNIFQIGNVISNGLSGVSIVVPQYIKHQTKFCKLLFINLKKERIEGIKDQHIYSNLKDFELLFNKFFKPDLVVFNEVYYKQYLKIYKYLIKQNISYIIIPHGCLSPNAQRQKRLKKKIANLLFFNRFIKQSSGIQCLSKKEFNDIHYKTHKFIGTNGVDAVNLKKIAFSHNISFIFIGRLDIYTKGLDLLLKAIQIDSSLLRDNKCILNIYGPKMFDWNERINKMIRDYKIEDLVTLNESIRGKEKENVLLKSDVFVLTSRSEGMPLGALEAMNYGLPCLVTRGTGIGEIVQQYDAGFVAENDAQSISVVLKEIIYSKSLKQKSINACKLIDDNFIWDTIIEKTMKEYQDIVDTRRENERK